MCNNLIKIEPMSPSNNDTVVALIDLGRTFLATVSALKNQIFQFQDKFCFFQTELENTYKKVSALEMEKLVLENQVLQKKIQMLEKDTHAKKGRCKSVADKVEQPTKRGSMNISEASSLHLEVEQPTKVGGVNFNEANNLHLAQVSPPLTKKIVPVEIDILESYRNGKEPTWKSILSIKPLNSNSSNRMSENQAPMKPRNG